MTRYDDMYKQKDALLDLVRSADPIAGEDLARPDEKLLRRIVTAPRDRRPSWFRRRPHLALAAGLSVLILGGAGAALAVTHLGSGSAANVATIAASDSGVSDLHTLASSVNGLATVVEGTKTSEPTGGPLGAVKNAEIGDTVVALSLGSGSMGFTSVDQLLANTNIYATTGGRGQDGSVKWIAAAGVVTDRVAKVVIVEKDGETHIVELTSNAFAVEITPSFKTLAIVAYDKEGKEVGRVPFPEAQAPEAP